MSTIDKANRIKKDRIPRTLSVKSVINITPNMRRVTLHGKSLATFPTNSEGRFLKLLFEQPNGDKPIMRTYTVSEQRR